MLVRELGTMTHDVFSKIKYRAYTEALTQLELQGQIDFECRALTQYACMETQWGAEGGTFRCSPYATKVIRDKCRQRQQWFKSRLVDFRVVNGQLVHLSYRNEADVTFAVQKQVVSQDRAKSVVEQLHSSEGHPGVNVTFQQVCEKYCGITMKNVRDSLASCTVCKTGKGGQIKEVHNKPIRVYKTFQRAGIDLTQYHDIRYSSSNNNRKIWLLVYIDYFSAFGQAWRVNYEVGESGNAEKVAEILVRHFRYLGHCPREIQSDNGSAFTAKLIRAMAKEFRIQLVHARPYKPSTGGRFEKFCQTFKTILDGILAENCQMSIDEAVALAVCTYNNRPHSALSHRGKVLAPIQVWQPQVLNRLCQGEPMQDLDLIAQVETDDPIFNEEEYDMMTGVADKHLHDALQARMMAENKLMQQGVTQSQKIYQTVSVGTVGIIPVPAQLKRKSTTTLKNLLCRVTKKKKGRLEVEILRRDKEPLEMDLDMSQKIVVSAGSFCPMPNETLPNTTGESGPDYEAAGVTDSEDEADLNVLPSEHQTRMAAFVISTAQVDTTAFFYCLRSLDSNNQRKIMFIKQWVEDLTAEKKKLLPQQQQTLVLSLLSSLILTHQNQAPIILASPPSGCADVDRIMEKVKCTPLPQLNSSDTTTQHLSAALCIHYLWPHITDRRIKQFIKDIPQSATQCSLCGSCKGMAVHWRCSICEDLACLECYTGCLTNQLQHPKQGQPHEGQWSRVYARDIQIQKTTPFIPSAAHLEETNSENEELDPVLDSDEDFEVVSKKKKKYASMRQILQNEETQYRQKIHNLIPTGPIQDRNSCCKCTSKRPCKNSRCSCYQKQHKCSDGCHCIKRNLPCQNMLVGKKMANTSSKTSERKMRLKQTTLDAKTLTKQPTNSSQVPHGILHPLSTCYVAGILQVLQCLKPIKCLLEIPIFNEEAVPSGVLALYKLLKANNAYMTGPIEQKRENYRETEKQIRRLMFALQWNNEEATGDRVLGEYNDAAEFLEKLLDNFLVSLVICADEEIKSIINDFLGLIRYQRMACDPRIGFDPPVSHIDDFLLRINVQGHVHGSKNLPDIISADLKCGMEKHCDADDEYHDSTDSITKCGQMIIIHIGDRLHYHDTLNIPFHLSGTCLRGDSRIQLVVPDDFMLLAAVIFLRDSKHYTTIMQTDGIWTHYDGTGTKAMEVDEVKMQLDKNGYILFYEKTSRRKPQKECVNKDKDTPGLAHACGKRQEPELPDLCDLSRADDKEQDQSDLPEAIPEAADDRSTLPDLGQKLNGTPLCADPCNRPGHEINHRVESPGDYRADPMADTIPLQNNEESNVPSSPNTFYTARMASSPDILAEMHSDESSLSGGEKHQDGIRKKRRITRSVRPYDAIEAKERKGLPPDEKKLYDGIKDRILMHTAPDVEWNDIVGAIEAKKALTSILRMPQLAPNFFSKTKPSKGILMYGPPGTGKTMLARAAARESNMTFFQVDASLLVSKWLGESEKLVKLVFMMAKHRAPSVIFIDEIDALATDRNKSDGEDRNLGLKTQLMQEIDGFKTLHSWDKGVFIIGATNCPWNIDHAIRRRLDKRVFVGLPASEQRRQLIEKIMPVEEKLGLSEDEWCRLISETNKFSGADIENLCREVFQELAESIFSGMTPEEIRKADEQRHLKLPVIKYQHFQTALHQCQRTSTDTELEKYEEFKSSL